MAQKNTQEIDSKLVLIWVQRVKVQRVQKTNINDIKSMKDFDHIQTKIADKQQPKEQKKEYRVENCKYCGAAHMQRQCSAFAKTCSK